MGKRKAITDAQARAFTATAGREAVLWDVDVPGLGLRARPSGRKTWFVHRRVTSTESGTFGAGLSFVIRR